MATIRTVKRIKDIDEDNSMYELDSGVHVIATPGEAEKGMAVVHFEAGNVVPDDISSLSHYFDGNNSDAWDFDPGTASLGVIVSYELLADMLPEDVKVGDDVSEALGVQPSPPEKEQVEKKYEKTSYASGIDAVIGHPCIVSEAISGRDVELVLDIENGAINGLGTTKATHESLMSAVENQRTLVKMSRLWEHFERNGQRNHVLSLRGVLNEANDAFYALDLVLNGRIVAPELAADLMTSEKVKQMPIMYRTPSLTQRDFDALLPALFSVIDGEPLKNVIIRRSQITSNSPYTIVSHKLV